MVKVLKFLSQSILEVFLCNDVHGIFRSRYVSNPPTLSIDIDFSVLYSRTVVLYFSQKEGLRANVRILFGILTVRQPLAFHIVIAAVV